jgi:hypothetical protein
LDAWKQKERKRKSLPAWNKQEFGKLQALTLPAVLIISFANMAPL